MTIHQVGLQWSPTSTFKAILPHSPPPVQSGYSPGAQAVEQFGSWHPALSRRAM